MIQGLRLLPFLQETAQRAAQTIPHLLDCASCQRDRDIEERQEMRCGYLKLTDGPHDLVWCHPGFNADAFGPPIRCAGYSCKLPAVLDVVPLTKHWERGTLIHRHGQIADETWERIEELDAAIISVKNYVQRNRGES